MLCTTFLEVLQNQKPGRLSCVLSTIPSCRHKYEDVSMLFQRTHTSKLNQIVSPWKFPEKKQTLGESRGSVLLRGVEDSCEEKYFQAGVLVLYWTTSSSS